MNKLIIVLIVAMIIAVVGFVLSGVVNATAQKSQLEDSINQTNSTQSERQKITGVQIDFIAQLNDSGKKFDEIADLLDKVGKEHSTHTPGHVRQV